MKHQWVAAAAAIAVVGVAQGADNGIYVGAGLGQSRSEVRRGVFNLDDQSTGYQLFAGIRPLDRLAFELQYVDFGRAATGLTTGDGSAVGGFVVGFLPLVPTAELYAKVGYASWKSSVRALTAVSRQDGEDVSYGGGIQLRFGSLAGRLEYQQFDLADSDRQQLLTLGISWTFL
jgi:hypothetical protein